MVLRTKHLTFIQFFAIIFIESERSYPMDKQKIFEHFSKILDNMIDDSLFFQTYFQQPSYIDDIDGAMDDPNVPEGIHVYFGATRGCILDEDCDYVVKFDIDEDAESDSLCEREYSIYHDACAQNMAQYLAPCYRLGTYVKTVQFYRYEEIDQHMNWCDYDPAEFDENFANHEDEFGELQPITIYIPLYAYPKASYKFPYCVNDEENERCNIIAHKIFSPLRNRSQHVAITFIQQYGEEEYQRFSDFLLEENINDLHTGNCGVVDSHFVIIDYAGYHSLYDSSEGSNCSYE